MVDVYLSERGNATAAESFFKRAIAETGVQPAYHDRQGQMLPASAQVHNGLERDHGHLKQRLRPMRGFKCPVSAGILTRGHALIQNLRGGFSALVVSVPRRMRLSVAWAHFAQMI